MRLGSHTNKLETNLVNNKTQDFGIGDASIIIDILRNRLYKYKVRTLVQEYISNARDSMRAAKNTKDKIIIHSPTNFSPIFKVRDFGTGMSERVVAEVFTKYGSSTKRESDDQTGGFGIGGKSAWSYTDSFTVVSYLNGIKTTYVAHTGVNNQGRLDTISSERTDEKNGIEIAVSVKQNDVNEFRRAIFRAIYFWNEIEKPIVKGVTEFPTKNDTLQVGKYIEVFKTSIFPDFISWNNHIQSYVSIDGIVYPFPYEMAELDAIRRIVNGKNIVLHLPSSVLIPSEKGHIQISATREELTDNDTTKMKLTEILKEVRNDLETHIKSHFSKVKSLQDFIEVWRSLGKMLNLEQFNQYKNIKIYHKSYSDKLMLSLNKKDEFESNSLRRKKIMTYLTGEIELDKIYYNDNTESQIVSSRKLKNLLNSIGNCYVYKGNDVSLIKELKMKSISSLPLPAKEVLMRNKVIRNKNEITLHDFTLGATRHSTALDLAHNDKYYIYVEMENNSTKGWKQWELHRLATYLKINVCGIAQSFIKKISKDKNFIHIDKFLNDYKVTTENINHLKRMKNQNRYDMTKLIGLNLNDKFLTKMQKQYETFSKINLDKKPMPECIEKIILKNDEIKEFLTDDIKLTKLLKDKFSLIYHLENSSKIKKEIEHYINSK